MVAFFARRLVGGVATWLVASFLFYSLLVSPGIPVDAWACDHCILSHQTFVINIERAISTYAVDKPWPANYLTWLFDPSGTTLQTFMFPNELSVGGRPPSQTFMFMRSGLLTGDLGYSWVVYRDTPALVAYGFKAELFVPILAAPLFLGLLAVLQRQRRLPACRSTRIPANAGWRPAELWAMG